MAKIVFECDNCGKPGAAIFGKHAEAYCPENWFSRMTSETDALFACSNDCAKALEKRLELN